MVCGALLSGCATAPKPIANELIPAMRGQAIALIYRPPADEFAVMTVGRSLAGLLGGIQSARAEGREFVDKYKISDPSIILGERLSAMLQAGLGMRVLLPPTTVSADGVSSALSGIKQHARFALETSTGAWFLAAELTSPNQFRVVYSFGAKLFDTQSGNEIASSRCFRSLKGEPSHRNTLEELLADDARQLKAQYSRFAEQCAEKVRGDFKIPAT